MLLWPATCWSTNAFTDLELDHLDVELAGSLGLILIPGGDYVLGSARPLTVRYPLRTGSRRQDSGDAEHVFIDDDSACHGWHGIDVKAGSHHNLGIRGFVEADHRLENPPAIRQMPGGSVYLKLRVETRGCSRWPGAVEEVQLQIRSIWTSRFSLCRRSDD